MQSPPARAVAASEGSRRQRGQSPPARAVAASEGRSHQGHQLVAGVGSAWGSAQVQVPVNQLGQAQLPGQGGGKHQPGIGHQAVVVEGDLDAVGVVAWQHLLSAPFLGLVWSFTNHYPRYKGAPSCRSRSLTRRPTSVDSGLTDGGVPLLLDDRFNECCEAPLVRYNRRKTQAVPRDLDSLYNMMGQGRDHRRIRPLNPVNLE